MPPHPLPLSDHCSLFALPCIPQLSPDGEYIICSGTSSEIRLLDTTSLDVRISLLSSLLSSLLPPARTIPSDPFSDLPGCFRLYPLSSTTITGLIMPLCTVLVRKRLLVIPRSVPPAHRPLSLLTTCQTKERTFFSPSPLMGRCAPGPLKILSRPGTHFPCVSCCKTSTRRGRWKLANSIPS